MRARSRWLPAVALLVVSVLADVTPAGAKASSLERARAEANAAAGDWARAQTRLSRLESEVRGLRARTTENERRLTSLRTALRDVAIAAYVKGRSAGRATEFAVDPSAKMRADALARFVTVDARDAVDEYRQLAGDLDRENQLLAARQRQSRGTVVELRKRVARIQGVLQRLQALEAQRLAREAAVRRRSRRTTGSIGAITRFRAVGDWMCPVQGPRAFSNDFGAPRGGGRRRHQGNDILAPRGTPVVAPVSGNVHRHDNGLGGISFYLDGVDNIEYYGAHLSRYAGRSGFVQQGTVIGYVGNTGDARGGPTHLHFEMHPGGGRAVNPYPTLRVYC